MENSVVQLSEKDRKYRELTLNGNMWRVVLHTCIPLAIFQVISQMFNILDTMMASHISAESVSAIAYLSQMQNMINALGVGLAVGGGIKISQAYGGGDYKLLKSRLNSLIGICFVIACIVLVLLPFTPTILRITGTPESFIDIGTKYFIITLLATVMSFFNSVYLSIERARGNSKRIMILNTLVIVIKLVLTALFIYGLNGGISMIALATLISQTLFFVIAVKNLNQKNAFGLSLKSISFKKSIIGPIIALSFPAIVEKSAFSFGKVVVNSMSKGYGTLTVGALGVSNQINGVVTNLQNGFQDGGAAIISQNVGGGKIERAIDAFKKLLVINTLLGLGGWLLMNVFIKTITLLFTTSAGAINYDFQNTIIDIFRYDSFGGCVPLGINAAIVALLLGFGYTKLTLIINFCRVFVFRIPILWGLQNFTSLGSESMGIVMAASNILVTMLSVIIAFFTLKSIKKQYSLDSDEENQSESVVA